MNKQKGISTTLTILLIVLLAVIVGGVVTYKYYLAPGEEVTETETTEWKDYVLEEISQDFKSPDFYDRHLVGIQDNGQRDVIVPSIKEALGEPKENIEWYPREVSFPFYSSKIFFVKHVSETAHSMGLIMFDVKSLTFKELTEVGEIYQNYYNYESLISADGFKIASLGYNELYLLDLLNDEAKLLVKSKEGKVFDPLFWPAKENPDFVWLDDNTIQYPVYFAEKIYDPPIEIRQISIKGIEETFRNETADWKTYRSEKYGFEVKYPLDWKVINDGVHYFGFDKRDFDVCFDLACTAPGIIIELHPNDNIETFWLWEIIQEGKLSPTIKVIKKEVVTIRNREITKALLEQGSGWQDWNYLFDSPEIKGFTLFSANTAKRDQIVYDLIAEKMLSTFRFIEKPQDGTADWKTYRNEDYGFEIKYPKEGELSETFSNLDMPLYYGIIPPEQQFSPIEVIIHKEFNESYIKEYYPEFYLGTSKNCNLIIITSSEISEKFNQDFEGNLAPHGQAPIEKIKIGGEEALKYHIESAPGSSILIWLLKDGKGTGFMYSYSSLCNFVAGQILSTFRFLE